MARLAAHIDLLPTLIDLCGLTPTPHVRFDGVSLAPLLRNPATAAADWPDRTLVVHNQRVIDPIKGKNCAVMTDRWRLVNGRELHEIKSDPGQHRDVADQHPQVVADLRKAYDNWWNDISTEFGKPARIIIGSDRANPTALNPHDWIGRPHQLFDQGQVRRGRVGRDGVEYQGYWMIEVAQDGRYEIEFRRWPRELNRPITAGIEGGTALPATQACLRPATPPLCRPWFRGARRAGIPLGVAPRSHQVTPLLVCSEKRPYSRARVLASVATPVGEMRVLDSGSICPARLGAILRSGKGRLDGTP